MVDNVSEHLITRQHRCGGSKLTIGICVAEDCTQPVDIGQAIYGSIIFDYNVLYVVVDVDM